MWILYQTAVAAALAVAGPLLLLRRGRHYLPTLRGRLGGYDGRRVEEPLWLHAVSVGEARVAATLAAGLGAERDLVVTTTTPTGQQQAIALLGSRAAIAYFPFDLGFAVRRFLGRFAPRALVLVEGDYWPLVLRHARRRSIPIAVVNGRVGDGTFRRWQRWKSLARRLYGAVDRFAVQTQLDRERLEALGVEARRIHVTGNLKFDAEAPPPAEEAEACLEALAGGRPIVVAGSTMPGEEATVLDAFRRATGGREALLVVAPRHPERWNEVAGEIEGGGFTLVRRGDLEPAQAAEAGRPDVVLLDSLGELAAIYRLAVAAFVGGTLAPTGGHNPIEPALFGVPTAVGPSMHNFKDTAARFDEAAAWRRVAEVDDLAAFFGAALDGDLEELGIRARELVESHRGATARTLEALAPLLARLE